MDPEGQFRGCLLITCTRLTAPGSEERNSKGDIQAAQTSRKENTAEGDSAKGRSRTETAKIKMRGTKVETGKWKVKGSGRPSPIHFNIMVNVTFLTVSLNPAKPFPQVSLKAFS